MNVERELQIATGVKQRAKESRVTYIRRMLEVIGDILTDDEYESLSEAAQKWSQDATDEFNAANAEGRKPNPAPFPTQTNMAKPNVEVGVEKAEDDERVNMGADEEGEPAEEEEVEEVKTPPKSQPIKRGTHRNTGKRANKPGGGGVSMTWRMKELIAYNPKITKRQLSDQLLAEGYTASQSTVLGILSDFRQSLFVLNKLGFLKDVTL